MPGETTQTGTTTTGGGTPTTGGGTADKTTTTTTTAPAAKTGDTSIIGDLANGNTETAKTGDAAGELELKLPEGWDPLIADFRGVAKELKLEGPTAQKLVDLYVKAGEPLRAEIAKQQADRAKWAGELKADKVFGGANYDKSISTVRAVIVKYDGAEAMKAIHEAGIGSHPAVVKFLARVGSSVGEDSVAGTTGPGKPAPDMKNPNDLMYPSMASSK